ncbi:schlafen family member 13 isoform X2 [Aplysia californica]|uniref:Schlafen family member 13 isoform X2 n=1 Tax=Aplysia californica TaxID=6500 RepID=A0ABM0JLM9_APLCA|nr:schlafen family member 13 isoform X2 [Aplysia californica]
MTFFREKSHSYGDIFVSCSVHISKGIHSKENNNVLESTCALLNSGGGILVMHNVEHNKKVQSKTLDAWWSGMESNLANILSGDDICNYLDFVGNFDDKYFYLFVKSAEHLCTVEYHCRLPTDTATHSVSYKSAAKICAKQGHESKLSDLPVIPTEYEFGVTEATLKQEGKQIQFKQLTSGRFAKRQSFPEKVGYYCSRYITAFANHEGGHIYFGIEDTTAAVMGEELTEEEETHTVSVVEKKMGSVIWSDPDCQPVRGVHWDIEFFPVFHCPDEERRRVIVVSVCKMPGGVFSNCPEAFVVSRSQDSNSNGDNKVRPRVEKLAFRDWKAEMLSKERDVKMLRSRFVKIPMKSPRSRLIYSLPHTLQASREKVIKLRTEFNLQPKNVLHSFSYAKVKDTVRRLVENFVGEPHLVVSLEAWGLELELPCKPEKVKAVLAVFSSLYGLHVVSVTSGALEEEGMWQFTKEVAVQLKQVLVHHGGCSTHLGFKVHVVDVDGHLMMEYFQSAIDIDIYPQTYKPSEVKMNDILNSLTVAIASYKPFSCKDDADYYFLLTCDQLELMWSHQFTRDLWVHGPPGSGKTIAALEMIRELRRRGCGCEQILYVAENPLLCSYVNSFDLCTVVSRRQLMSDGDRDRRYKNVLSVVVDEAQNFKDRDGDWYSFLDNLSKQNVKSPEDLKAGYFWLFMDYAQKVHKFNAGLPGLIGKHNFMLREISRNSKEIYEYATKFMEKPSCAVQDGVERNLVSDSPHLAHEYKSGQEVNVVPCKQATVIDMLKEVLQQYTQDGVSVSDMAVLVSKKKEVEEVRELVAKEDLGKSLNLVAPEESRMVCDEIGESSSCASSSMSVPMETSSEDGICESSLKDTSSNSTDNTNTNSAGITCTTNSMAKPQTSSQLSGKSPLLVTTVRDFSGLDKPVIIGLDPHTNQEHADFDKFLLNLVTRAKDSLVILTSSDALLNKLRKTK